MGYNKGKLKGAERFSTLFVIKRMDINDINMV
ncbi:hypothetical protein DEU47_101594 [Bacillus sp. AG236]|jgi:hypothetical protein|nr:hypothetical protein DEU47_101594 [Bacillus sp. AG236]